MTYDPLRDPSRVRKPLPLPPDPLADWNLLGIAELSEELPPIAWVCESLRLAPGAVSLIAGYGYSRKTMALQSLALSIASGKPVWGVWSARKGTAVHLDYEQGRRTTQGRYQKLARGMGFELAELEKGSLRAGIMPRVYLSEDGIYERLCKLADGVTFVIVDSLKAAFPNADENSSDVRSYLDILSRVSERTGACFAVIHHARKPSNADGADVTHAIRGSSALFDACQSVFVFAGAKDIPTIVHHQKDRIEGATLENFGLTSVDVAGATGPKHALRVVHLEPEQIAEREAASEREKEDAALADMCARILEIVGPVGGPSFRGSRVNLRSAAKGKTAHFDAAMSRLTAAGAIERTGPKTEPVWIRTGRSAS